MSKNFTPHVFQEQFPETILLGSLYPEFPPITLGAERIDKILQSVQAFWRYQEGDGHPVLRNGKHSNGYVSMPKALGFVGLADLFALALLTEFDKRLIDLRDVTHVVSSDHSAATFGQSFARFLGPHVQHEFSIKVDSGEHTWTRKEIPEDAVICHIEEMSTSLKTPFLLREAIAKAHDGFWHTYKPLGIPVSRIKPEVMYANTQLLYKEAVFLREYNDFQEWEPDSCPLCTAGSPAVENMKDNWHQVVKIL